MIEIKNATKVFEDLTALDSVSVSIKPGCIYGLIGTNGSGKSTLLRLIAGIYKADAGDITLDGMPIYENTICKDRIFFVSDDLYFQPQATLTSMAQFYRAAYPRWSEERYKKLCQIFPIAPRKKLATFSKGMRRQAAFILALASSPDYLMLDESFDGLDPVIRHAVRKIISDIISEFNITVIISSHNLRELEDFCDRVGLLHMGQFKLECEIDNIHLGFSKVQTVFKPMPENTDLENIKVLSKEINGSVITYICAATEQEIMHSIEKLNPLLSEIVSLTLEEVFIYEMEAVGYDYSKIIF